MIARNLKGGLLYTWFKTNMYPAIPCTKSIESHEEVYKLSKLFNATPVFTGIRLKCVSPEENNSLVYGAGYIAVFIGFKAF